MFKKKLFCLLLTLTLILTASGQAFASNVENYYDDNTFEALLFSYTDVTNNSNELSSGYYNELKGKGLSSADLMFVNNLLLSNTKQKIDINNQESTILFLQDNYDKICSKLSIAEKEALDKYLLDVALKYYNAIGELPPVQEIPKTDNTIQTTAAPAAAAATVCTLTIFADKSTSIIGYSSGFPIDAGTHAWIHIKNTSSSPIIVGTLSVAAGSSRTVGTWGNKPEHLGGFYNLEGYYIGKAAYNNRYSTSINLTATQLNTLNSTILYYDGWSAANNCSAFAARVWNATRSITDVILNAGIIPTPKNLANDIINKTSESYNASCPYGGYIYYNLNAPTRYIP